MTSIGRAAKAGFFATIFTRESRIAGLKPFTSPIIYETNELNCCTRKVMDTDGSRVVFRDISGRLCISGGGVDGGYKVSSSGVNRQRV